MSVGIERRRDTNVSSICCVGVFSSKASVSSSSAGRAGAGLSQLGAAAEVSLEGVDLGQRRREAHEDSETVGCFHRRNLNQSLHEAHCGCDLSQRSIAMKRWSMVPKCGTHCRDCGRLSISLTASSILECESHQVWSSPPLLLRSLLCLCPLVFLDRCS